MLRWLVKMVFLVLLAGGFFYIAFDDAPDLAIAVHTNELMAASPAGGAGEPEIRVLVIDGVDLATLTINGQIGIVATTMQMQQKTGSFKQSVSVPITPTGNGIKLGADLYVRARIKPLEKNQPIRLS